MDDPKTPGPNKAYSTPLLIVYGSVQELTRGNTKFSANRDSFSTRIHPQYTG
ncbi:MAG: lasso RiPP family leader peptide-containing protein [Candidatus Acidiferrales bacterium]